MIDKLKFLIDNCEEKPKLKKMLLKVAELKEENQERMLKVIEIMVSSK